MARTVKRTRVVGNTGRRASGKTRPKHRSRDRSNPGDILGFTLAAGNPGRKANMKTKKHKAVKKTSSHRARGSRSKYKPNTGRRHAARSAPKTSMRRYKKNSGRMGGGIGPMVTNAVFVIVGALGSKLGAQAVLGTNNVGLLGYAGNAAAGGLLWFLADKVMRNPAASAGVLAGTIVQIVLRILNDYTPFGGYLAQLGMGDYQMQSFVTPQVLVDPMRSAEIQPPPGWGPQPMMLPAASSSPAAANGGGGSPAASSGGGSGAGMSGLYGGGWGGGLYG